jgi:hypothetical protein
VNFVITKISNHGVSHPFVARLSVQTSELIKWADLPKEDQQAVSELYMATLQPRLLKCFEILCRLRKALEESAASAANEQKQNDGRIRAMPHVVGLQGEVESFLYETKNYLRDVLSVLRFFLGFNKIAASQFCDVKGKGESQVAAWSRKKFGADDDLTKLLKSEQVWVEQLARMRDAVEHPDGWSGRLTVHNVRLHPQGFIPPSWSRTGCPESDIFTDMETTMDNLLNIAEDLLVACIKKRPAFGMVEFYEIEEKDRNLEIPQRIRVGLTPGLERKLAEKAAQDSKK